VASIQRKVGPNGHTLFQN